MSIKPQDPRLAQERPKRKAGEPKSVDLLELTPFLRESISPAVKGFGRQVSNFFGSQRGDRPTDEATLKMENRFREKWVAEMSPLETFTDLINGDRNALRIIPGWSDLEQRGTNLKSFEICLIRPSDVPKFNVVVRRGDIRILTDSQKKAPLLVCTIQLVKGAELSTISKGIGIDPARSLSEEEKEQVRRIRVCTQKIIADSTEKSKYRAENYPGVDIKEFPVPDNEGQQYIVRYIFPTMAGKQIRDLEAMGIIVNKDLIDDAEEFLRNTIGSIKRLK